MRVLLATDGSPSARVAVDLAAGLAWPEGSELHVVDAIETGTGLFGGPWPSVAIVDTNDIEAEIRARADADVEDARQRLERAGVAATAAVVRGRPASAIVEAAREMSADLVIVGSRGHGAIESMLLGSVSAEVVDHATVPVLVARKSTLGRIVLAWDGSDSARGAAEAVRTWPVFRGASVRVVSVADLEIPWWTGFPATGSPEIVPMYVEAAEASRTTHAELARAMAERLREAGLEATGETPEGDAATAIVKAAGEADLVVVGSHGWAGLRRLFLGSVARNVLHHAPCSVLVVRGPASAS